VADELHVGHKAFWEQCLASVRSVESADGFVAALVHDPGAQLHSTENVLVSGKCYEVIIVAERSGTRMIRVSWWSNVHGCLR
jgi:hypothetical protein